VSDIDLTSDITSGELDSSSAPAVAPPPGTVPAQGADTIPVHAKPSTAAPEKEATEKPRSLREQLSSAYKGDDGKPSGQADATSNTGEQPRGPDGKFAPKTPAEQAAATDTNATVAETVSPPQGLSPEEATQFAALPKEMQQYVARTMASVNDTAERYRGYDQLEQVIGNRRQAWAMQGMSEAQAVNQLLALSDFAGKSPVDFVRWFSGQHGISVADLEDTGGQQLDPVVADLRNTVQSLNGRLTELTQGQQQEQHNARVRTVELFANEKGADNQPLRPYFAELGNSIVPVIAQVKAENPNRQELEILSEAYERACWAHPTVRVKMLAAQEAQREATRLEQVRTQSARSQSAAASVSGEAPRPGSTVARTPGNGSVRDTLREQFSQYH
jgi:hypothetical protein